jgi:hypothetical protein
MKCPCEECISYAICASKDEIRCSLLYKYLEQVSKINANYCGVTVIEDFYNKNVSSCFPIPKNRYYIKWEEDK